MSSPILAKIKRIQAGKRPRLLDLFAGCGGMSLGFQAAGYTVLGGIEIDPIRASTYARNFPKGEDSTQAGRDVTQLDPKEELERLTGDSKVEVDILVGGPPCQAYARVGRAKLREIADHPEAYQLDPRGQLYAAYLKWVEVLQPIAVVMENVPDILSYGKKQIAETIAETLDKLGYETRYTLLNAAFYGVPQTRERWFLIGIKREAGVVPEFPSPSHYVVLPKGYLGTRSHALAWAAMTEAQRPFHAVLLKQPSPDLPAAITSKQALSDLPAIPVDRKMSRKARNLDMSLLLGDPQSGFQELMRTWRPGYTFEESKRFPYVSQITAHVTRCLPRDHGTFKMMKQGDFYPQAIEVAEKRFQKELELRKQQGKEPVKGSDAWMDLRNSIVPPYDKSKFPNKWWKLVEDFPCRTLLAHLSHDTYSHIHYSNKEARTISVREAARLQSFPDSFVFCGAMNTAFGQIGNAVPPLMAAAIGEHLLKQLMEAPMKELPRPTRRRLQVEGTQVPLLVL
jgi:DNA (cytosine-5)-methyltransferase 1